MRRTGRGLGKALLWIIVLSLLAGCAAALYIRDFETPLYRAAFTFYVTPIADGDPVRFAKECQLLTQTERFQQAVLEKVQSDGKTRVKVEAVNRTYMLEAAAYGPDAQIVQALANGVGEELCRWLPQSLQAQSAQEIEAAKLPAEPFHAYRRVRSAAVTFGVFLIGLLLAACLPCGRKPLSYAASQADAFCLGAVHDTRRSARRFARKKSRAPEKNGMFLESVNRLIREDVRQLALVLRTSGGRPGPGSCLFTAMSEDAEDGAVVVLLASELALQGFRVLLVEMDAARRPMGKLLGTQASADLYDCLKGRCEFSDAVLRTGIPTLFFVDSLHADVPVASIAATSPFAAFVRKAQEQFDFVLIHAAPRRESTDAAMLGLTTGASVLIARDEAHTLEEIETAAREMARLSKPAKGVIFTRV